MPWIRHNKNRYMSIFVNERGAPVLGIKPTNTGWVVTTQIMGKLQDQPLGVWSEKHAKQKCEAMIMRHNMKRVYQ